jgi:aminoglycoside phosphotransferase (APT) family kinase protein
VSAGPAVVGLVAAVAGDRLLVRTGDHGPTLPPIDGEDGEDGFTPGQIFAAAGVGGVIMAPATRVPGQPILQVHVLAVDDLSAAATTTTAATTISLDDLGLLSHPAEVAEAVRTSVAEFRGQAPRPALRPAWFAAGWLAEVDAWVDQVLERHGQQRRGATEVVKFWSLSAVLRIPVHDGDGESSVFFKAACDWFRSEPAATELIGRLMPGVVPGLLGLDPERAWMLMREFSHDVAERDSATAVPAARAMARLQRVMVDHVDEALAAGLPDRRLESSLAGLALVISESVELGTLTEGERATVRAMEPWLAEQVTDLAEAGLPYTIGHGDLHLGNVALSGGQVVIFDWTDAAVTFPVLDAALLARSVSDPPDADVLAAYAAIWREGYPASVVERSLRLAPLVNRIYQAISYEGIYRAQEERTRWEAGGVVASTLRSLAQDWIAARDAGWQRGHQ